MTKRRFSDSTVASVRRLTPIDDVMFQKICESKATCQEIISTILGQEVKVLEVVPQDSPSKTGFITSFRSGMYCRLPLVGLRTRDAQGLNVLGVAANERRPVVFASSRICAILRVEANTGMQRPYVA